MCVLDARTRVPQIYIKVLLAILFLESSRCFLLFPFAWLKKINMSENYLNVEEGREILAGCGVLFYLRGVLFSFFTNILLIFSDMLKLNWFYRKHTCIHCPDPTITISLYLLYCISVHLSIPPLVNSSSILSAFQSKFLTSVHFPLNTSASPSLNRTLYCLWLLFGFWVYLHTQWNRDPKLTIPWVWCRFIFQAKSKPHILIFHLGYVKVQCHWGLLGPTATFS